jgi:hypothetical protein
MRQMPMTSTSRAASSPGHVGIVAGRYRDGSVTDKWTDVKRCAERTFVAYLAVCSCGWHGPDRRPGQAGGAQCSRDLAAHLRDIDQATSPTRPETGVSAGPRRGGEDTHG